jgi:YihY family inner membrane protein
MNPVEKAIRTVDATQQRFTPTAFVFGVFKKYGDDNGGVLVANLAHSGFVSLFPLLLVAVTILAKVAAADPALLTALHEAISKQFPGTLGRDLLSIHRLHRSSTPSLILGLLLLSWGATGLAQAGLFTMNQVWNLPGPARPGYFPRLGRCVAFLLVLGGGVILGTGLTSLTTFGHNPVVIVALAQVVAVVTNTALYLVSFRVLTPKGVPSRKLVPGAVAGGIAWTIAQALGTYLVHHFLRSASIYGIFVTVLGLLAWISLAATITVYAAEINVVLDRQLWPRSIVQPPLTEADRASMALQALQNQRRPEQDVAVTYHDREDGAPPPRRPAPRTPDEVAPPAKRGRRDGA